MTSPTLPNRQTVDPYEPRTGVDLYAEVAPRIILPEKLPYLIYGIGIARSGTTVSLNVMTSSVARDELGNEHKIHAGYQHFKAGYRHAMHGWPNDTDKNKWTFEIPDASVSPVFYIKDPLGPYTKTESEYNPLRLLEMKGYPKNKLFLLFFFRDPEEILASWKRNWEVVRDGDLLRENLITACHTLRSIHQQAGKEGYANKVYLYESLRDHPPETVVGNLFDRINADMFPNEGLKICMTDHTVGDWDAEEKQRIWHPDEPAIYEREEISGLHSDAKTKQRLTYKKYPVGELDRLLTPLDHTILESEGTAKDYEYFRRHYVESSGLQVCTLDEVRGRNGEGAPLFKAKEH